MKYTKTLQITNCNQLEQNPPQCGQWIKLAWCDKPSRFHHISTWDGGYNVTAFHFPGAVRQFNSYSQRAKAAAAFAAFNRHARKLSQAA